MATVWNFLVFDDDPEILDLLVELLEEPELLGEGSVVKCTVVDSFLDAQRSVNTGNYDLVILDLEDAADDAVKESKTGKLSGEKVLETLKNNQFIPVIFHTGYADKITHLESHFVKVVRKGAMDELVKLVIETFATKLPGLIRYIQEEQRKYLWGHVESQWDSTSELKEEGEVAYLLARRLANSLSASSIRRFFNPEYDSGSTVLPIEYYVWPSVSPRVVLGDIYRDAADEGFYLVINPACDLEQCKAESVLLVACKRIEDFVELEQIVKLIESKSDVGTGKKKELVALLGDNRRVAGGQPDRYKYLPGTSFIPHLVADFQSLSQIEISALSDLGRFSRVATLDTPFAEGVQTKFSRYYGRFGVPDLNFDSLATDIIKSLQK